MHRGLPHDAESRFCIGRLPTYEDVNYSALKVLGSKERVMNYLKRLGAVAIAASVLFALVGTNTASATELTCAPLVMCLKPTTIHAESQGHVIFHPTIGNIECSSTLELETTTTGSVTETITADLRALTFTGCTNGAVVTVLAKGNLELHTEEPIDNGNGLLTFTGQEITFEQAGFHCIFKTSSTALGRLTGSGTTGGNAVIDFSGSIPRTGGRSGAFCGSSASVTGTYKVTKPIELYIH